MAFLRKEPNSSFKIFSFKNAIFGKELLRYQPEILTAIEPKKTKPKSENSD
jgi:hypothetical protein